MESASAMSASNCLESLLGAEEASRFLQGWPGRPSWTHSDRAQWPAFLRLAAWSDPELVDTLHAGPVDVSRGNIGQYPVRGASIKAWVCDLGLAVRLPDLRTRLPGASEWITQLEAELGAPPGTAELNAFINPPGVGLGVHCDPSDHLLIQVAGEKTLRLHPNPAGSDVFAPHAVSLTPSSAVAVQYPEGLPDWSTLQGRGEEIHLRPGSIVYLPRGTYHETQGGEGPLCTSLVLKFALPTFVELALGYLREYLLQDPAWRRCLVATTTAAAEAHLHGLLAALGGRLGGLDAGRILATHRRTVTAANLRPDDRLVRNPAVLVDAAPGGGLRLRANLGRGRSRTIPLGAAAMEIARALADTRRPLAFGDVLQRWPAWDPTALAELVAFLVRSEVLVALVPEPWACAAIGSCASPTSGGAHELR